MVTFPHQGPKGLVTHPAPGAMATAGSRGVSHRDTAALQALFKTAATQDATTDAQDVWIARYGRR